MTCDSHSAYLISRTAAGTVGMSRADLHPSSQKLPHVRHRQCELPAICLKHIRLLETFSSSAGVFAHAL